MNRLKRWNWRIAALFGLTVSTGWGGICAATPWWLRGAATDKTDFLMPDAAFRVGSRVDGDTLRVHWVIANGYYLYKQKMQIKAESPDLIVAEPTFPPGTLKTDPYLGTQEIYVGQVEGTAAFRRLDYGAHPLEIKVTYQGCALAGLCYPPITKVLMPLSTAAVSVPKPSMWEGVAIGAGGLAFLLAGLLLRKGRRLATPA